MATYDITVRNGWTKVADANLSRTAVSIIPKTSRTYVYFGSDATRYPAETYDYNTRDVVSAVDDVILYPNHPFADGEQIGFDQFSGEALNELIDKDWYVVNSTEDSFQISETLGGTPEAIGDITFPYSEDGGPEWGIVPYRVNKYSGIGFITYDNDLRNYRLLAEDFPGLRDEIHVYCYGDRASLVITTEEAPVGTPLPPYVAPEVVTYEVYGVNLESDSIYLADSASVALGTKFKVTTPGTLQLDGVTPVNYVTYHVAGITTEEIDEETYKLIRISSREDRSRIVDVTGGPVVDEENEVFPAASGIILTVV
jgi:hypothetical protein